MAEDSILGKMRTSAYLLRWWDGQAWTEKRKYNREPLIPEASWQYMLVIPLLFSLLFAGYAIVGRWISACFWLILVAQATASSLMVYQHRRKQDKITLYQLTRHEGYLMAGSAILCGLLIVTLSATSSASLADYGWLSVLGGILLISSGCILWRSEETFYQQTDRMLRLHRPPDSILAAPTTQQVTADRPHVASATDGSFRDAAGRLRWNMILPLTAACLLAVGMVFLIISSDRPSYDYRYKVIPETVDAAEYLVVGVNDCEHVDAVRVRVGAAGSKTIACDQLKGFGPVGKDTSSEIVLIALRRRDGSLSPTEDSVRMIYYQP